MIHTEKANSDENGCASIGRNSHVTEKAEASGHYVAECYGPREEVRDVYCKLRDRADLLEKRLRRGSIFGLLMTIVMWFIYGFNSPARLLSKMREQMDSMIELKWRDTFANAVCPEGKNYVLDKAFAGSAFTAAWYVGLFNSGYTVLGSETYAAKGATENTNYSNATRPAASWSAASAGSKALSSPASFSINGAGGTIGGCFLNCGSSTKGDSTASAGVNALWSIGAFSGGNKTVASGDTLNVSYSTGL